jgi:hypothetical protein
MTSLWILRIKCTTSFYEGSLPNSIFEREWQFAPSRKKKKIKRELFPFSQPTLKSDKMTTIASYSNPIMTPEVKKYVAHPMVRVKDDEKTIPFLR